MIQTRFTQKGQKGFTLIELLVVIAIIGVLASVVLASLNSARQKSRDARRIADVKELQLALELYYDANSSSYPVGTTLSGVLNPLYIAAVSTDPQNSGAYPYQGITSAGAACSSGTCSSYVLGATMEAASSTVLNNDIDGTVAGVDCTDANKRYCVQP